MDKNNLWKKSLAVAVILSFISMSVIPSTGGISLEKPHKAVQELTEQRISTQILTYDPCLEIYDVYSLLFFYIVVEIRNTIPLTYENVNWSITLKGGIILHGRETHGTISKIHPDQIKPVSSNPILGIGRFELTVKIHQGDGLGETSEILDGFVFGPFVFVENYRD